MNHKIKTYNQYGIASAVILILIAVVIGLTALGVGFFVIQSSAPKKETVTLPPEYLMPSPQAFQTAGTPECPDIDYTGCDTSADWMTWDGQISETTSPPGSSLLEK